MRALVIGVLLLVACGDDDAATAPADAGTMADGGSVDSGDDADVDAGNADDAGAEACACTLGERCVAGRCEPSRTLRVAVFESESAGTQTAAVAACLFETGWRGVEVAREGACRVYRNVLPADTEWAAAAGEITVSGLAADETRTPTAGCTSSGVSGSEIFTPDQSITFRSTGGADVPAFERVVRAPGDATLVSASPFGAGDPFEVVWDPAGPGDVRIAVVHDSVATETLYITCDALPAASGRITIPASLTAMISPVDDLDLRVVRSRLDQSASDDVLVELEVASIVTMAL